MLEITIEIRVRSSTTQETVEKILTLTPFEAHEAKVEIESHSTLDAKPQMIELEGIATAEAFGMAELTVELAKTDRSVDFLVKVITETRKIAREFLIQVAANLIVPYILSLNQNLIQQKDSVLNIKVEASQELNTVQPNLEETLRNLINKNDLKRNPDGD